MWVAECSVCLKLRGLCDIHTVPIHTINTATKYTLNKLQLMKNIKLLHVSAQGVIIRDFLKKILKKAPRYRDM